MDNEQKDNLNKNIQKCLKDIKGLLKNTNHSDIKEIYDTVMQVQLLCEEFPYSEELASSYLFSLTLLAKKQDALEDLDATVAKAYEIYSKFPQSEQVADGYLRTLVLLAKKQDSLEGLNEIVTKAYEIYSKFPQSEQIADSYLRILVQLAKKQGSPEDLNATVAKAHEIYSKFPQSELLASGYLFTLMLLAKNQETLEDLDATVAKVYEIYSKFPQSEQIADGYLRTLVLLAKKQGSLKDLDDTVAKTYEIYNKFPQSEQIADGYLKTLMLLANKQETLEDLDDTIAKTYEIYNKFPQSKQISSSYLFSLTLLAKNQDTLEDLDDTVAKAYEIYSKFPQSEQIADGYLRTLMLLANKQGSLEGLDEIVAKSYEIYRKFPQSEQLASGYLFTLMRLAKKQETLEDLDEIVAKAYEIYSKFPQSEQLASGYLFTLMLLAKNQETFEDLDNTVVKAYEIYSKFPQSEQLADGYLRILVLLAKNQRSLEELDATVAKAFEIYSKFSQSEQLASGYLFTLMLLAKKQETFEEIEKTVTQALDIYNCFPNSELINWLFALIISKYIDDFVLNSIKDQKDDSEVHFEILFEWISDVNVECIVNIIDNIFSSTNNLEDLTDDNAKKMSELLCRFSRSISLKQTKYAVLISLLRDLESKGCQLEPLIKIYYMVQMIKYQLSVKDFSNINFGHYTSGEVLQILIKQETDSNKNGYSIEGRTRLGNVKYMNDPEEGRILDRYLKPRGSNNIGGNLKPSPWFLMSLTTAIDNLAMWSQYGAKAEGVCLVFKEDSFAVVNSIVDTEWLTKKNDIPILEKELKSNKYEEKNSNSKKDYLYRICYFDEDALSKGNKSVVKSKDNNMLEQTEITSINNCLQEIKKIVRAIKKEPLLCNAVEECLEEIRYLFKVSGYSYESELRILQYADLNPNNKKIKIDSSGPVAKLYLERDMPIQLKQVIFGPKFSKPEHVTPLLYLLDKNIEFKRSDRKFK